MPLERRHRSILRPTESLKRSGEDWALMLHFYLNLKLELLYEKRILTSKACHRELRSFRVNGRVWTFSTLRSFRVNGRAWTFSTRLCGPAMG